MKNVSFTNYPFYKIFVRDDSAIHSNFLKQLDKWNDEIYVCDEIIKQSKKEDYYEYAIKRYVRINKFILDNLIDMNYKDIHKYRSNIITYYKELINSSIYLKRDRLSLFMIKKCFWLYKLLIKLNVSVLKEESL